MWILIYCLTYSIMLGVARYLSSDFHPFQITFFRAASAILLFLPWVSKHRPKEIEILNVRTLNPQDPKILNMPILNTGIIKFPIFWLRILASYLGMLFFYMIIVDIPLATVTALMFLSPIVGTVMSILILKEKHLPSVWFAFCLGLVGMMVILKPEIVGINRAILFAIGAIIAFAVNDICTKQLTKNFSPADVAFFTLVIILPVSFLAALRFWNNVEWEHILSLGALGLLVALAQTSLGKAFSNSDISVLLPFNFSSLIFTAAIGYVWFGETIGTETFMGAIIIIAGGLFLVLNAAEK